MLYYLHEKGELQGTALKHVDNFILAVNDNFLEKGEEGNPGTLKLSKVEKNMFRFTS